MPTRNFDENILALRWKIFSLYDGSTPIYAVIHYELRKTAQALLGHSDLGTTLNTYAHVIPDSQRPAVEGVTKVSLSNVLESEENAQSGKNQRLANAGLKN